MDTVVENIAKLDDRLLAVFQSLGLRQNVMAVLAELGVININALHAFVDDRKQLCDFLKDDCGANPAKGGYKHTVEAGTVVSAMEQSGKRVEVENKRHAERIASNLPPQLTGEEVLLLKKSTRSPSTRSGPSPKLSARRSCTWS